MGIVRQALGLIVFLIVCFGISGLGAVFTTSEIPGWYATLRKPTWTPPSWVFGPVWSFLYLTMAIAAWLVWRRAGSAGAVLPLAAFFVQLALNLAWSWIFFGLHRPGLAFADIVLLWAAIVATVVLFWRVTPIAGALLLPYLAWVSFASALNLEIWRMNR